MHRILPAWRDWGVVFLLCGAVLIAYGHTLSFHFLNLDDPSLITENPLVSLVNMGAIARAFTAFDPELYTPLTTLSHQFTARAFGLHPFPFHVVQLALHLTSVFLAYTLVRKLSTSRTLATLTAFLFAVHPMNAEAVSWLSARKDVLSAVLFLGAIVSYLCYVREKLHVPNSKFQTNAEHQIQNLKPFFLLGLLSFPSVSDFALRIWNFVVRNRYYILSLLLFSLALLSKVSAAIFPLALLLIDDARGRKFRRTALMEKLPFFALSAVFLLIAIAGKAGTFASGATIPSFLLIPQSIGQHLAMFWLPIGQPIVHELPLPVSVSPLLLTLSAIGIAAITITLFLRRRMALYAWFGWALYLIALLPSLGQYPRVGVLLQLTADRYAYLPSIGLSLIAASVITATAEKLRAAWWRRAAFSATFLILLLPLAMAARSRASAWRDSIVFNTTILEASPRNFRAHYNLAFAHEERGRRDSAKEHYRLALALHPRYANAAMNLGILLMEEGKSSEALGLLQAAVRAAPRSAKAQENLGAAYERMQRWEEATRAYERVVELAPMYADAYRNLARAYGKQGKYWQAMSAYQRLIELDPAFAAQWGGTLEELHRYSEASP